MHTSGISMHTQKNWLILKELDRQTQKSPHKAGPFV